MKSRNRILMASAASLLIACPAFAQQTGFNDEGKCGNVTVEFGFSNYEIPVQIKKVARFRSVVGWDKTNPSKTSTATLYVSAETADAVATNATGQTSSTLKSGSYFPGRYMLRINKFAGSGAANTKVEFCVDGNINADDVRWGVANFQHWN